MNKHFELAIVVPAYNEAKRISVLKYVHFLKNTDDTVLCFVNDGSTDDTLNILNKIANQFPERVCVIDETINKGKAEAVRVGALQSLKKWNTKKIAYLDADLSTALKECYNLSKELSITTHFTFGSRIAKLDSTIKRKTVRFFIGRIIATLISNQLKLKVYDTQCGCKVFRSNIIPHLFKEKFISRWLFDVEIFHRLIKLYGKDQLKYIAKEIPLKSWIDTEDSRVPLSYFFKLWIDLRGIKNHYKKPLVKQYKHEAVFK